MNAIKRGRMITYIDYTNKHTNRSELFSLEDVIGYINVVFNVNLEWLGNGGE